MSEWTKEYTRFRKEITELSEKELISLEKELKSLNDKHSHLKYLLVNHERIRRFPSEELKELFEQWRLEELEDAKTEENYGDC